MKVRVGCDLVSVRRFKEAVESGGQVFLEKLFSFRELASSSSLESLAGLFAAKESVIKALAVPAGDWHAIEIIKDASGKPDVYFSFPHNHPSATLSIASRSISITHDGEYAFAITCVLIYDTD